MQYLGGKARLRDQIVPIINAVECEMYLEPFCGACWVGEIVNKPKRVFSDANKYLIAMWKAIQEGWVPPEHCTEEEYYRVRDKSEDLALRGFVGIAASFGGKFWGGYARGKMSNGEWRDYTKNCYNQIMKRRVNFSDCHFLCEGYSRIFKKSLSFKSECVMYLDPPYEGTTSYAGLPPFDSKQFWGNVRVVSKRHYVITSGYTAPEDFKVIREFQAKTGMNIGNMEKLFAIGRILEEYDL